jgi:hypothetical protein
MNIDLEKKSIELKNIVSQYDSTFFLGEISSMVHFISMENPTEMLKGLSSPLRQLYYLAGLNITSKINADIPLKFEIDNDEWDNIKKLINDIEIGYTQFFYPKSADEVDDDWKMRRIVAMPSFLSYFNQGPLNYEEQVIERIIDYFSPFNQEIKTQFGLDINDFINIYNFIDSLPNKFLEETINSRDGQPTWRDFTQSMEDKGLRPDQWVEHLPDRFKAKFEFIKDKGKLQQFQKSQLVEHFGIDKTNSFLNPLTCERHRSNFLYYTENNILHSKPLYKISNDAYRSIELNQILHAIFSILFEFCINNEHLKDKFYEVRGVKLEDKIEKVVQSFFNNKAIIYKGYYTQEGHEQDLLVLVEDLALIIEAKASKRKEPRREPDKAYPLILSNFDEVIQKGYDQAYRVKSKFLSKEVLHIYKDQQLTKHICDINTKKFYNVFSIIVTLERFGQIQTDLSELLEVWDYDEFPWSVCIDDLEVFLLVLKKLNRKKRDFSHFLHLREKLHQKLICSDELEVCGAYLKNLITYKVATQDKILALTPDLSCMFDDFYHHGGIGFTNEKNMDLKTDENCLIIGEKSTTAQSSRWPVAK